MYKTALVRSTVVLLGHLSSAWTMDWGAYKGRKAIAEAKKSRHGQVQGEIPLVRKTGKRLQNKAVNVSVPDFANVSYRDFY